MYGGGSCFLLDGIQYPEVSATNVRFKICMLAVFSSWLQISLHCFHIFQPRYLYVNCPLIHHLFYQPKESKHFLEFEIEYFFPLSFTPH